MSRCETVFTLAYEADVKQWRGHLGHVAVLIGDGRALLGERELRSQRVERLRSLRRADGRGPSRNDEAHDDGLPDRGLPDRGLPDRAFEGQHLDPYVNG